MRSWREWRWGIIQNIPTIQCIQAVRTFVLYFGDCESFSSCDTCYGNVSYENFVNTSDGHRGRGWPAVICWTVVLGILVVFGAVDGKRPSQGTTKVWKGDSW